MRKFWKMHGAGNDFVLLDCRSSSRGLETKARRLLCDRHLGIGCDQLIEVYSAIREGHFALKFSNQDGGETGACGNGSRCAAAWLMERTGRSSLVLEVGERELPVERLEDGAIWVGMGAAEFTPSLIPMDGEKNIDLREFFGIDPSMCSHAVACSMGNPHLVLVFSKTPGQEIVHGWGAKFEHHEAFPQRANIGFACLDEQGMQLRVWERGVGETLACASGACAAFAVVRRLGLVTEDSLHIRMLGGGLDVQARGENIHLTGPVVSVYEGQWYD